MWKILLTKRTGSIIDIVVYDCFAGDVKLLKKGWGKFYVEIVDVSMCYPCQHPLVRGDRMWIENNELIFTKKSALEQKLEEIRERIFLTLRKRRKEENDLPF